MREETTPSNKPDINVQGRTLAGKANQIVATTVSSMPCAWPATDLSSALSTASIDAKGSMALTRNGIFNSGAHNHTVGEYRTNLRFYLHGIVRRGRITERCGYPT